MNRIRTCATLRRQISYAKQLYFAVATPRARSRQMSDAGSGWSVRGTLAGRGAVNMIRQCEETHFVDAIQQRNKQLDLIKLSIGDPAVFGNLPPDPIGGEAIKRAIDEGKYNGYGHSRGILPARQVVAVKYSKVNEAPLTEEDVIMTSSCSGALELCLTALAGPGQNFLIPKPGFALFRCHLGSLGVEMRYYSLKPESKWEVDLAHMEQLIDSSTAGILINNPSNPCGSVYTKQHLREIANVARKHHIPIVSDETYAEMVFKGEEFHSIASVATDVPVLVCGGISKQFLVPGWRLGWILIHDQVDAFTKEVRPGLFNLAMRILGPCTLVQAALPDMLEKTPKEFHQRNIAVFEENACLVYKGLKDVPGLNPVMPSGAMYMMVGIDTEHFPGISNDIDFTKQLVIEQSVFCLPGDCFAFPNYFRIVLVMPPDQIEEACRRIAAFCGKHYQ